MGSSGPQIYGGDIPQSKGSPEGRPELFCIIHRAYAPFSVRVLLHSSGFTTRTAKYGITGAITMTVPGRDPALDAESRVGEIIAILVVASVLSTLVVALRLYCRAFMLRSFGWDDGLILPAQVCHRLRLPVADEPS